MNNPLKYADPSGWQYVVAVSEGGGMLFYNLGDYMIYLEAIHGGMTGFAFGSPPQHGWWLNEIVHYYDGAGWVTHSQHTDLHWQAITSGYARYGDDYAVSAMMWEQRYGNPLAHGVYFYEKGFVHTNYVTGKSKYYEYTSGGVSYFIEVSGNNIDIAMSMGIKVLPYGPPLQAANGGGSVNLMKSKNPYKDVATFYREVYFQGMHQGTSMVEHFEPKAPSMGGKGDIGFYKYNIQGKRVEIQITYNKRYTIKHRKPNYGTINNDGYGRVYHYWEYFNWVRGGDGVTMIHQSVITIRIFDHALAQQFENYISGVASSPYLP